MWCRRCQQDVPAVAMMGDSSTVCCARCGSALRSGGGERLAAGDDEKRVAMEEMLDEAADELLAESLPRRLDDLSLEDDLSEAERLVRRIQLQTHPRPTAASPSSYAPSAASADDLPESNPLPPEPRRRRRKRAAAPPSGGSLVGWTLTGLGLSGLVCGCALLGWSFVSGQSQHWNTGLPVALISQAVLACGVVLQMSGRKKADHESRDVDEDAYEPPTVTHLHVHAGVGMQPMGVSVHYGSAAQQQFAPPSTQQLEREIQAAMHRRAA